MHTLLSYNECLGLKAPDRLYYVNKTDINPATGKAYAINPQSGVWDDNYWANSVDPVVNAQQKAQDSLKQQQQAVTDAATAGQAKFDTMVNDNKNSITDFLGNYKNDVLNATNNANSTFHIPEQADALNALNTRITQLKGNTDNAGAGGYANAGQVDAAVTGRYMPNYQAAISNLNTSEGLAQQNIQNNLAPDLANADLLKTNITTAMSGLTATQQNVLQGLIANLNGGVALTQTQLQTAEQLAQQVLSNAGQLAVQQSQNSGNLAIQNSKNAFTPIPAGNSIVNPFTGTIINPGILTQNNGVYK